MNAKFANLAIKKDSINELNKSEIMANTNHMKATLNRKQSNNSHINNYDTSPIKLWESISKELKIEIGNDAFNSWFSKITSAEITGAKLILTVNNAFVRDWIIRNHKDTLLNLCQARNSAIYNIDILVEKNDNSNDKNPNTSQLFKMDNTLSNIAKNAFKDSQNKATNEKNSNYTISNLDYRFTFDNFVVGKSNEFAFTAAKRVAKSVIEGSNLPFNPLFLYGGVGLGKTHLMHAIAAHIKQENHNKKVVYLSAEKFMFNFIRALRFNDIVSFKQQLRDVDILMVDDLQFIIGKESTQEEFFHTFNELTNSGKQIVISADKSPLDLEGLGERIKSRLGWGLVADLHPTTYELRVGILQLKLEQMKLSYDPKVLELLAKTIHSNVRELEGALNKLAAHSTIMNQTISCETALEVLKDLIKGRKQMSINIDKIQTKVCEYYKIKLNDLKSAKRVRSLSLPRQIAIYFVKKFTTMSLPEIGRNFGGRDHTTILHAIRKIEKMHAINHPILEDLNIIERSFSN